MLLNKKKFRLFDTASYENKLYGIIIMRYTDRQAIFIILNDTIFFFQKFEHDVINFTVVIRFTQYYDNNIFKFLNFVVYFFQDKKIKITYDVSANTNISADYHNIIIYIINTRYYRRRDNNVENGYFLGGSFGPIRGHYYESASVARTLLRPRER